ncbi:MAG: antibiotic biosynthesis monooxygenase [Bacteroidota bacterium]
MILEAVIFNVIPGREIQFEQDFAIAGQYISAIRGYIKHSISRCIEQPNQYLLLVEWETLEAHTIGFRESVEYLEWKRLLHHYYDPFPVVQHYQVV